MQCARVVLYVEKCENGLCKVTREKTDVCQGWRHRQESTSMKRFAGLSLIHRSSLHECRFPTIGVLGLVDYALDRSA